MSYNQLPPPPPDRVGMQPGGPYGGPQLAGPGGAYGPVDTPIGQPVPGQLPPPEMTMAKPRSILGIQVILWIFAALAAIADLFSAMNAIEYENPLALIGLAFAVHSTIQSMITPVQITRGKRWAWIWALVSAILGLAIAAFAIVFGLSVIEVTPVPVLIGVVLGGLYLTLTILLSSKSAREWILMHRIQRGEVPVHGTPGPGMVPVAVEVETDRPDTKPGSVTAVQLMLWAVALSLLVWIPVLLAWHRADEISFGGPGGYSPSLEEFMVSDFGVAALWALIGVVALSVLAVISAVGLQRGRFWARVFSAVWGGLAAVGALVWFAPSAILAALAIDAPDPDDITGQRVNVAMAAVALAAFVLALWAFILLFKQGVRSWTSGTTTIVEYRPVGGGAPQAGMPQGPPVGPPGYTPQQGYAPRPGSQAPQGPSQQPGPYGRQPQPGYQPPQQQYPPQQPPYPGGY